MNSPKHSAPSRGPTGALVATVLLLSLGLVSTAGGGVWRSLLRSLHCREANRAERAAQSAGYYNGLIDGQSDSRDELTLTLMGKPPGWANFTDINAARYLRDDFLQFELRPNVDATVMGTHFTTNSWGMRDRPYTAEKPAGTFRVAVLGSSIDMGWGVDTPETYENRLEDWLNTFAGRHGLARRFEVLNFAMAAYSPLHRLEVFERKVAAFQPDLVIYSSTRLDTRLLQIHLVGLLQQHVDLKYEFVRAEVLNAGIVPEQVSADHAAKSNEKTRLKTLIEPRLAAIEAATIARLASLCRAQGLPLCQIIIPRATEDDAPESRSSDVARLAGIAQQNQLNLIDLSDTFDDEEPGEIEIAPWDDHPNARGHQLLFISLGRQIVANRQLYLRMFGIEPPGYELDRQH
jgi:hypothetical protein